MRKINYNLAADRKINGRSFAWRAALLVLATLLLAGLAAFNLSRQFASDRGEKSKSGLIGRQIVEQQRLDMLHRKEIAAWKKERGKQLTAANRLIQRKSFSFIARLDFLENIFGPGLRLRKIELANESSGRIKVAIAAQSLKELYELYKKLAPFELIIANETQTADGYLVSLNFGIGNEKL